MNGLRPFQRVPTELWTDIFESACSRMEVPFAPNMWLPRHGSLHPKNQALVIRNVCHQWREVIQSSPICWSKIALREDCWRFPQGVLSEEGIIASLSTRVDLLSDILRYSGTRPLHILIRPPSHRYMLAIIQQILSVLVSHSERWVWLHIDQKDDHDDFEFVYHPTSTRAFLLALSHLNVQTLPSLKTMSLFLREALELPFPEVQLGSGLPKLRTLVVRSGCPPLTFLPWDHLSQVEFSDVDYNEYRDILPHLQSAVKITIMSGMDQDWIAAMESDQAPFTLPQLQELCLNFWDLSFFSIMKAPHLRLVKLAWLAASHARGLVDFITRSQCAIQTFILDSTYPINDTEIDNRSLIYSLPALQKLTYNLYVAEEAELDEDHITSLLEPLSRKCGAAMTCCSHLEELQIDSRVFYPAPAMLVLLVDMIEARWSTGHLKRVTVPRWRIASFRNQRTLMDIHLEQYKRLETMKEEGLDVSFILYED